MATQKDLDVLKQKLRDLDAKLKSMGGGSAKRDPRFDSAMANQTYANLMRDQQARLASQQGQFTQGRLMGAPTNRPIPQGGGLGGLTADQAGIPADQRKILDDEMAKMQSEIAAGAVEQQKMKNAGAFTIGGTSDKPIYGSMAGPVYADGSLVNAANQQMKNYQDFLQQGMQRNNIINQGAMTDFANMEPGMQATQPATAVTPKPAMPVAGMGMQQSNSAPRKFSTVKASPPRFG